MLLDHRRRPQDSVCLLPVLYHISTQHCVNLAATSYGSEIWAGKPAKELLQSWAVSLKELLGIAEVCDHQVWCCCLLSYPSPNKLKYGNSWA